MTSRPDPPVWVIESPGLTALALLAGLLMLSVFLPYLQFILFGVILAYISLPIQQRAEQYVTPTGAALATVAAMLVFVLIPLTYMLNIAIQQSLDLVRAVRSGQINITSIEELIETAGFSVNLVTLYDSNRGRIAAAIETITSEMINFAGSLPGLFIGLTITLFVLFALLRDRKELLMWVQWVLPIDEDILDELREGFDQLMWASIVGNALVAVVQALLLGVGLAIAGVPAVIFLTVATFVLTLLPLIGAFGVWIPAVIYLVANGRPVAGTAIAVYGLLISISDFYLRPALIGQTGAFNSATIVIGIFGGLVVFGAVGLFIGPVVVGGTKLIFDCFARTHNSEQTP